MTVGQHISLAALLNLQILSVLSAACEASLLLLCSTTVGFVGGKKGSSWQNAFYYLCSLFADSLLFFWRYHLIFVIFGESLPVNLHT